MPRLNYLPTRPLAYAGSAPSSVGQSPCVQTEAGPENCNQQGSFPAPVWVLPYLFGYTSLPPGPGSELCCQWVASLYPTLLSRLPHLPIHGLGFDRMVWSSVWSQYRPGYDILLSYSNFNLDLLEVSHIISSMSLHSAPALQNRLKMFHCVSRAERYREQAGS